MKVFGKGSAGVVMILALLLSVTSAAFSQEERKMELEEYEAQLAEWQQRETEATNTIEELEADIAGLKSEISQTENEIDETWDEIYAMLGTDEAGYEAYKAKLQGLNDQLDGFAALSPEEKFRNKDEISDVAEQIEEAKMNKLSLLTEMENLIGELEGKLAAVKSDTPANIYDEYTVAVGDYLWKISAMEDIYGNPYQWIRIYNVNKDQIKDPDLIYPEQVFKIARGVAENEHLVVKGEYLSKIAGMAEVFNDPTKWTNLYEANKDIISDPSLIYPYQVITVPGK